MSLETSQHLGTTPAAFSPEKGLGSTLLLTLVIAVAYYIAGRLSLTLAIPPGYATAVWPPAGIALAAALLYGKRSWPGIVAGSFLINVWTQLDSSTVTSILHSSLLPMTIALGAMAQAATGAWLTQRFVGYYNILEQEFDVVRLLVLGGPLACVIASTVGVGGLWMTGAIHNDVALFNWWTWWVGDSIGVLIFTPMILVWAVRPFHTWLRQQLAVMIPLLVLFVLVLVVFIETSSREQSRVKVDFETHTREAALHLQMDLKRYDVALAALAGLFTSSKSVTAEEFDDYARILLKQLPGLFAVSWNQVVPGQQRQAFEAQMRAQGFSNFKIVELNAQQKLIPAATRERYVVVKYIKYANAEKGALGLDVEYETSRRISNKKAEKTGLAIATESVQIISDIDGGDGLLMDLPVYRHDKRLIGFVTLVVRHDNFLARTLKELGSNGIELSILDPAASPSKQQILVRSAPASAGDMNDVMSIDIGQRWWELKFTLPASYLVAHRSISAWLVLAGGMFLTALLGVLLLVMVGRAAKIERRVAERTLQLRESEEQSRKIAGELEISEARHKTAEQTQRAIVAGVIDAIITIDDQGIVQSFNPAAERMFGWFAEEVVGNDVRMLVPPQLRGKTDFKNPEQTYSFGARRESMGLCRDNSQFPIDIAINRMPHPDRREYVVMVSDISERKTAEARIQHMAHHDALTKLPNRALLQERLNTAIAAAEKQGQTQVLGVMMLDLDHFKRINDSLGHQIGDQLLIIVADRLRHCIRKSDTVARMGGDEFVVLLSDVNQRSDIEQIADKIVRQLSLPLTLGVQELVISPSIGVCSYPADGTDVLTLLKNADTAMYHVKGHGRGHYQWFSQDMLRAPEEHLALTNALHRALEREEFSLHYQPMVSAENCKMVAVEALLRWTHPTRGPLPPSSFIFLAEDSGIIVPIGEWVLHKACTDIRALQEQLGYPITLAVNVSPRQFRQPNIVAVVKKALDDSGLAPACLTVEITESLLLESREDTVAILKCLREIGVNVAIDDFGTGYSSLSYLTRFPIDKLKIDGSFVRDLHEDSDNAAVVSAIIAMGKSLRMTVTAEGVETLEQLKYLRERGCDEIQGFLLSKGVPLEALPGVVKDIAQQYAALPLFSTPTSKA